MSIMLKGIFFYVVQISALQASLNELQPQILETLEALVNPKQMSIDRSKLHILLQDSKK